MFVRCLIIVMMFYFSWNSAGTWHSTAFFVLHPVWYGKIKYTANNIKLLRKCVSIHIFPEMTAEISDKLIHVRHIFVLVSFLVYGAVNNSVCLTFNGERKIYVLENQITKEKQGVLILQSLKKYAVDTTKNNIQKIVFNN